MTRRPPRTLADRLHDALGLVIMAPIILALALAIRIRGGLF